MSTVQLGANATLIASKTDAGAGKGTDLAGVGIGLDTINRAVSRNTRVVPSRQGTLTNQSSKDSSVTFSFTCDATEETDALFAAGGGQRFWLTYRPQKTGKQFYGPVVAFPVCTIDTASDAVTYAVSCTQDGPAAESNIS